MRRAQHGLRVSLAIPIALSAGAAAALSVDTIALVGEEAPGTTRFYESVSAPYLNDAGQVAYRSLLRDAPIPPPHDYPIYRAIHWGNASALSLVVQEGDAAPGFAGVTFRPDGLGGLNEWGQLAFHGELGGAGITEADDGVMYGGAALAPTLAAREGSAVPGIPGVTIDRFALRFDAVIDASGRLFFRSELTQGVGGVTFSNESLLLGGTPESIAVVARERDQAPGAPAGTLYSDNMPSFPTMTEGGTAYYGVPVTGSSAALFAGPLTSPTLVMRQGDLVGPDLPGAQLRSLGGSLNDAGQGIFQASLEVGPGGITSSNNVAIMTGMPGSLNVLLQRGQAVPGAAGLTLFFANNWTIGDDGTFSLRADLRDASNSPRTSILVGTQSDIRALAISGEQAPGLPIGALFGSFSTAATSNITGSGEMAFAASLQIGAGGVTASNDAVLYWVDGNGAIHPLLRRGDLLEVAPGDFRQVELFTLQQVSGGSPTSTGRHALNEPGQIAFHATFLDGSSGIFLAWVPRSCSNGLDDDGDGLVDFGDDPACHNGGGVEDAKCQNGIDDDGDGKIDFDGGASWNGGTPVADPDAQCVRAWRQKESSSCGVGAELVIALALLGRARRDSRPRTRSRVVCS